MNTKHQLAFIGLLLLFVGCTGNNTSNDTAEYRNEPAYQIQVGEAVEIFVKENSCCTLCWVSENEAAAVRYAGEKVVVPAPPGCDGCNTSYAWRFEGIAVGTDTIKIARLSGGRYCEEYVAGEIGSEPATYVVTVTP